VLLNKGHDQLYPIK